MWRTYLDGNASNLKRMWDELKKNIDFELNQVYLGCTQRGCETNKRILKENWKLFESLLSISTVKKTLRRCERSPSKYTRHCEFTNRRIVEFIQSPLPVLMIIHFSKRNWRQLENHQTYTRRLNWNVFSRRASADQIFHDQWTVWQELSRSGTKSGIKDWQGWYLTYNTRVDTEKRCHLGNTASECKLGLFQDAGVGGDMADSKSTSRGFGRHTFVPVGMDWSRIFLRRWSASRWNSSL